MKKRTHENYYLYCFCILSCVCETGVILLVFKLRETSHVTDIFGCGRNASWNVTVSLTSHCHELYVTVMELSLSGIESMRLKRH